MSPCRMKFRPTASLHDCDNGSLPRAPYRDRISGQPVARTLHPLDGIVTATATTGARPAAPHAPAKPAAKPSAFPRLAAIDIGTNSIRDRKSTRLNSSHTVISYAVFCLKKKNQQHTRQNTKSQAKLRDVAG